MDVIKRGVIIGSATKLGSGLGGILAERNLTRSSALPITTIGVVGTPQMVFINPIMTTHENKTINRPLMNSIIVGRYKSIEVENLGGGY